MTDEQRKQMKEASEQQVIKKIAEADLLKEAFELGRAICGNLENTMNKDSLAALYNVKIEWLEPGSTSASEIENQIIEAYLNSMMMGEELKDNVQSLKNDSLLYTQPVVKELQDGVVEIKGTWNIRISRKQLILAMDSK